MRLNDGEVLLSWPLSKHLLTVGNYYRSKDGTHKQWHGAIDMACGWDGSTAKPVLAAEPGTVVWVQQWDGHTTDPKTSQSYGNAVKIRHQSYKGTMLETLYAHLSRVDVAVGQQVDAGQAIGVTGNTGNCQGAHLHFEVRWGNRRYNPLCWLDDDWQPAPGYQPYRYGPGEHAVERPQSRAVWGYGIDTSKHQWAGKQPIDFDAVRASGKRFVIARAGLGWYPDQVDPYFSCTCAEARAAGLEVGAYWYSYAATPEDARKEAELFADTVRGHTLTMGLWMDQEYEPEILALTNAQRTEIVQAFTAEIERLTGTSCGLYCSRDWINSKLDADKLYGVELWVAAYTGTDSPGQVALPYGIWQTDGGKTGRCPGVDGEVDLDVCYKNYPGGQTVPAVPDKPTCTLAELTGLTGKDLDAVSHIIRVLGGRVEA